MGMSCWRSLKADDQMMSVASNTTDGLDVVVDACN